MLRTITAIAIALAAPLTLANMAIAQQQQFQPTIDLNADGSLGAAGGGYAAQPMLPMGCQQYAKGGPADCRGVQSFEEVDGVCNHFGPDSVECADAETVAYEASGGYSGEATVISETPYEDDSRPVVAPKYLQQQSLDLSGPAPAAGTVLSAEELESLKLK